MLLPVPTILLVALAATGALAQRSDPSNVQVGDQIWYVVRTAEQGKQTALVEKKAEYSFP
jgi:hypothetical protein